MFNGWTRVAATLILGGGLWLGNASAEDLTGAENLFQMQCKRCHGANGKGNAKMLGFLKLQDRGLEALNLLKDEAKKLSDMEMARIIMEGKGEKMKPFKDTLSPLQAMELTQYIRKLQMAPQL